MACSPKAVAPVDGEYVFRLGPECAALAESELRETDELRRHSLAALRLWIDQNPKIVKCRIDDSFLLRFLRTKKYSIPVVQETLERYVMLRENYDNGVFTNINLDTEANVVDLLNKGFVLPLPKRDAEGRRVLLVQPGVFDVNKHTIKDVFRLFTITADILIEDEENQIRGFVYLVDAAGASLQMLTLVTPKEAARLLRNGEAIVPMRHQLGVGYNIPSKLQFAVNFGLSFLSDKLRSRARQVADLASCPEVDRSILPQELGGTGSMTMAEMIALWKEEMNQPEVLKLIAQNDEMQANTNLFTKREIEGEFKTKGPAVEFLTWAMDSVPGSFRKMEVD